MSHRINTLRGPRLHQAPHFHRSKLARAPHLDSSHPTQEGFLKQNRYLVPTLAIAAILLAACAVDPSSVQAVPQQDGLKMLIEANPFVLPQYVTLGAGGVAGVSTLIVDGLKNFQKAADVGKRGYNYANATWDTIIDVVADASTAGFAGGAATLLAEVGISPKVITLIQSQLPLLGMAGLGTLAINMYDKVNDVIGLIRFPNPPTP
ncbi:hypothetical protein HZC27_00280 [Candidatus Roizmanbacteria bacterium]|nr:hypothetical protein [Candidatus Roizmanbacteria bacterium]